MEGAIVLVAIGAVGQAVTHDVIGLPTQDVAAHLGARFGGIGVVTIDHEVAVRVDVAQHLTDYVAFALAWLMHDGRTMLSGNVGGAVRRVVVVDVNRGTRHLATEVVDHLSDGKSLVIAGDENGDPVKALDRGIDCVRHA